MSADDWITGHRSVSSREADRKQLQADVDAFLKAGGAITTVEGYGGYVMPEPSAPIPVRADLTDDEKAVFGFYERGIFGVNEISKCLKMSRHRVQKARDGMIDRGVITKQMRGKYQIVREAVAA